ncbi:4a-hydroxytetrahydrobiopterin dehydratase [Mycolicibacterium sp. P9-64]|uniref:VOC family protein n=1 Tax=Mycolicibacterium sp. P9-64 TaxID=2024612 RepID=UPI0011ECB9EF|nr:VOC family protein [Mycolicibacterium sp. P9-64]KAA0081301.1 4a-hydroxytetrahydrobiopterin dehydratase [Mycolicibacterium sp. P9-64]
MPDHARLTRTQVSDAVSPFGWRLVLGAVYTEVDVPSLAKSAEVAAIAAAGVGADGQDRLTVDVRAERALLRLMPPLGGLITAFEAGLAREVSEALAARGFTTTPGNGDRAGSLQGLEIAIDAMDIAKVRPFWQAVTGYVGEAGPSDLTAGLIDPMGRGPAIWFQQMDEPRGLIGGERSGPGNVIRNRIHIDVDVPHDEGEARVRAALAAGGTLLSDAHAPAFWVLADPEGNEACVCTWQARD